MNMSGRKANFYAVVMAGGSGERFWPLSTPERPKQFLSVFGGKSLLRQTVDRLAGLVPPERILVVTSAALAKTTRRELPELPPANVVGEPCRRDTAAAAALSTALSRNRPRPLFDPTLYALNTVAHNLDFSNRRMCDWLARAGLAEYVAPTPLA